MMAVDQIGQERGGGATSASDDDFAVPAATGPQAGTDATGAAKEDADGLACGGDVRAMTREILALLRERFAKDQVRQTAFDRLYEELEGYKEDFILKRLRPMFPLLLSLHDGFEDYLGYLAQAEAVDATQVRINIESFRDELLQALEVCGVSSVVVEGNTPDYRVQRAVETVALANPAQSGKVVRVHRRGFMLHERVLRPELVAVGKYQPEG